MFGQEEPFIFKHYLILTRTYHLSPEELQHLGQTSNGSKRRKSQVNAADIPRFFHPEDEHFQQVRILYCSLLFLFRTCAIGIRALYPLSVYERPTKRGGRIRT